MHFSERSCDLSVLREANRVLPDPEAYGRLVRGIRERNAAQRAPFSLRLRQLGGVVIEHYWIINASAVRIDPAKRAQLAMLPGVERVQPNYIYAPALTKASNARSHNSDAANLMTVNSRTVKGWGVTVAILDTGIDVRYQKSNRPHRLYYSGGSSSARNRIKAAFSVVSGKTGDDLTGHGTMCSHAVGGASWSTLAKVDNGCAPECDFVGINIASYANGSTTSAHLTRGWQRVLADVQRYGIKVANNSYSGSPDPSDATQQALDSAVVNGDVLVTVPSGNNGGNIRSTQAGYNGLSVGSVDNGSRKISSFSGRGTTSFGKVVPDMVAVGAGVYLAVPDQESRVSQVSGTSFSAPLVAGAAALARQANPKLSALSTKALLLNSTEDSSAGAGKGAGYMRAELLTEAAVAQDVFEDKIDQSAKKKLYPFLIKKAGRHSVTITWQRQKFASSAYENLDLRIYDGAKNLLASSILSGANSYDKVEWTFSAPGLYWAEVTASSLLNPHLTFAIAGLGQRSSIPVPTLTKISSSQTPVYGGGKLTLTGTRLDTVTQVLVGKQSVIPLSASPGSLAFVPPFPKLLGKVQVRVKNLAGTSNVLTLEYLPVTQPWLVGLQKLTSFMAVRDELWMRPSEVGIYYLSPSKQPSKLPGIVDLGIGNGFKSLSHFGVFVPNAIGQGSVQWSVPPGFAQISFFVQAVVIDSKTPAFPLQSSNLVQRIVLF